MSCKRPSLKVDPSGCSSYQRSCHLTDVAFPDHGFKNLATGRKATEATGRFAHQRLLGTPPLPFGTLVVIAWRGCYIRNARAIFGHGNFIKYLISLAQELRCYLTTIFRCHICNSRWPTTNPSPISCPRMLKD